MTVLRRGPASGQHARRNRIEVFGQQRRRNRCSRELAVQERRRSAVGAVDVETQFERRAGNESRQKAQDEISPVDGTLPGSVFS